MADGCFYEEDVDSIQRIFTQNFLDHYTGDKTPFPLFFHSAWFFQRPHRAEGFFKFIDSILALPDVYFVTVSDYLLAILLRNKKFLLQFLSQPNTSKFAIFYI